MKEFTPRTEGPNPPSPSRARRQPDWRPWLRRKIGWLLLFKLAVLAVLWLLFFSPGHRVDVDGRAMSERLAPPASGPAPDSSPTTEREEPDDV